MLASKFWSYYKAFEQDIENYSRYVEITPSNFNVYSVELTRLFLAICSEIDVVLKKVCHITAPNKTAENIKHYRSILTETLPQFVDSKTILSIAHIEHIPFKAFAEGKTPEWWFQHNKVKHERSEHYHFANLGNVLEALAALYLANIYLYYAEYESLHCTNFPAIFEDIVRHIVKPSDLIKLDNNFIYMTG